MPPSVKPTPIFTSPASGHTNPPTPRGEPAYPAPEVPAHFTGIVDQARTDLAERLRVNPAEIRLVDLYADEFPASNLGCLEGPGDPRPLPAILSGRVIVLEYQDQRYIYHARRSQVVYCGPE